MTTIDKLIDSIANICINLGLRGEYSPEEIADLALSLAHDEARLSSMRNAMQESTARPSAEAIYAWLQAHR